MGHKVVPLGLAQGQCAWPKSAFIGDSLQSYQSMWWATRVSWVSMRRGTLARLNALRRELIDPAIAAHSGRIVKLMGDGALVEFASAIDAVTCAIEIQKQLRDHDAASTEGDPIQFRIGINVGDIIIEGNDIFGDGVNIAARIEGIAAPGGIALSEDAWRQVQGKVAARFVDRGEIA